MDKQLVFESAISQLEEASVDYVNGETQNFQLMIKTLFAYCCSNDKWKKKYIVVSNR
jgi:hypothetical protein